MADRPDGGKNFTTIQPTPDQKKQLAKLKIEFEKAFGVDQISRTTDQWRNLVRVYGMEQVCAIEKMTELQVIDKMHIYE